MKQRPRKPRPLCIKWVLKRRLSPWVKKGAYLHGHGLIPAFSVGEVVETTGAGDAFNGGFAAALSEGFTPVEAVRIGSATAGISVTRAGTAPAMPSRAEVDALL
jgi:ribokinase